MKTTKFLRLTALTIIMLLTLSILTGCGSQNEQADIPKNEESPNESDEQSSSGGKMPKPIILTSVGQSADVSILKALMEKSGIAFEFDAMATDIGDARTLVIAVGASSKGLGSAGIKESDELERTDALITEARSKDANILVIHIGGDARRGDLSDKFIIPVLDNADHIIVVEGGDYDGLFSNTAKDKNIPIKVVDSIGDVGVELEELLK